MTDNILNNEQLDQVVKTLEENKNETDLLLKQIEEEHKNDDNSNAPLETGEGVYVGDGVILESEKDDLNFSHFDNIDSDFDAIVDSNINNIVSSKYNITDEEALKFSNIIIQARKGKVSNVYENLPNQLKKYIRDMAEEQKIPAESKDKFLEYSAKMIIEELINDIELDAMTIDLEKAMKELLPETIEMYSETNRDYIENEFPIVAEKIREENPDKAKNLLDMRQGFIDAYKFEAMYNILDNSKILKNIRRSNKIWNRIDSDYVSIAGKSKFKLYPLKEIELALIKIGYSEISAKRILTLFVYTYLDGIKDNTDETEYNNIYRSSFANYFESNIINLAINKNLISDFSKNIKENLNVLSNKIDEVITTRENELSSKNKKRR